MRQRRRSMARGSAALVVTALASATFAVGLTATPATATPEVDCSSVLKPGLTLEQQFDAAARASGVPLNLLKSVSYLQSRWETHTGASIDGGYGPMHLTDVGEATQHASNGKGDGSVRSSDTEQRVQVAATLTGLPEGRLRSDAAANICGGAAVLASYGPSGSQSLGDWAEAVARYGSASETSNQVFANQVYSSLRTGEQHITSTGQRVTLAKQPNVQVPYPQTANATDCPASLNCEWLEAPYAKDNPTDPDTTTAYGNHDIADRTGPGGPKLEYIVIHSTEGTYEGSVKSVQDPTYLAWNYTLRSSDGHVAQHLNAKDVGWHAGNWYFNMHSIGLEHEGKAGNGGWFTEAMMRSSATLTKYLATKYDIPLDRGHIIGHDQIPGTVLGATKGVHWDPGPYFDWQHYFELLGKPVAGNKTPTSNVKVGDVVTVKPGFSTNPHPQITDCEQQSPGSGACVPTAGTNFVTLRSAPSDDAALASDIGTHPDGSPSTWKVNDVSARATAGQQLVVAQVQGDWVQVWWAGEAAWIKNPKAKPVLALAPASGPSLVVTPAPGATSIPVYGRAYPEASAYPATVPVQALVPLEYTIKAGQQYVVLDARATADYYRATSFNGQVPGDRTVVIGTVRYVQIELAHRTFFVKADDVTMRVVKR